MKTLIPTYRATALLVSTALLVVTVKHHAKPPQSPRQNASLEVIVTGDLPSESDHTGASGGEYDVCRPADFAGAGDDQLVLRKLRLDVTVISAAVPDCVNPGVPPIGLAVLRFPNSTAVIGDTINAMYSFYGKYKTTVGGAYEVIYHLDMVGTITGGQWPPPDGTTVEITLTAWTKLYAGKNEKNACKVAPTAPIPFASPVVFTITRNDVAHTDDACDCPFDYPADFDPSSCPP